MMRGTFANIRLKNFLAPGTEGGVTVHLPDKKQMSIYDAAMQYQKEGDAACRDRRQRIRHRLVARLGGQRAALLGIKAAIAESFERIHRSNLIGMGIVPLSLQARRKPQVAQALSGFEKFDILGISVRAQIATGAHCKGDQRRWQDTEFKVICRIDTPAELDYYRHGGILEYVLRQLLQN